MLQEFERPFTQEERHCIQKWIDRRQPKPIRDALRWLGLWLGVCCACMAIIATLVAVIDADKPWASMLLGIVMGPLGLVAVLAAYAAYLVVSAHRREDKLHRQFANETLPQLQAAMNGGRASVRKVTATGVIAIDEEDDDLDEAYLFDLGDQTCLLLRGFYLPEDSAAPWPAQEFQMVSAAANGHYLGVFHARGELNPTTTIKITELSEKFAFSQEPPTESILKGQPAEALAQLGYRTGSVKNGHRSAGE